jgi:hypothetical protein
MTSLSLKTFDFSIDYFINEQFVSNCQDYTHQFDVAKFDHYLFSSIKLDYLKIEYNLKNDFQVIYTIERTKELLGHIDNLATQCKAFKRNRFDKPEKFTEFLTTKLKLNERGKIVSGEYIYLCLTLVNVFPNRVEMLKSELEDLLVYYENKLTINVPDESQKQFISNTSSQKQHIISYQISAEKEPNSEKKIETPITFENQQNKRGKIIWKDADLLFALFFVLLDLNVIVKADCKTAPDYLHFAEIIFNNFYVKKKKGKGFYTLLSLEKEFSPNSTEFKKHSKVAKYKKELLNILQPRK